MRVFGRDLSNFNRRDDENQKDVATKPPMTQKSLFTVYNDCGTENSSVISTKSQNTANILKPLPLQFPTNPVQSLSQVKKNSIPAPMNLQLQPKTNQLSRAASILVHPTISKEVIQDAEEDEDLISDESLSEDYEEQMSVDLQNMSLEDIDSCDIDDPQFVTDYVNEIFSFMYEKEKEVQIPSNYFAHQPSILPKHRDMLVKWITDTSLKLKLLTETMFLAVNIVDRVISLVRVSRRKLPLVGVASLLIASKFEETYAPPMSDFKACSDCMFDEEMIMNMERILLTKIDFNLCAPVPVHFLRRFSKAARSDSLVHTLSKYISELSVISHEMNDFLPSEIAAAFFAAASVLIARKMKDIRPVWSSNLAHYTKYTQAQIYALC